MKTPLLKPVRNFLCLLVLLTAGAAHAQPVPPSVVTLPASALGVPNATLNGMGNPNGTAVFGLFEWGTTTNYGNRTGAQPLGSGSVNTNFSQQIAGLSAGATYHFRAVASNNFAVVYGTNQSFTLPFFADIGAGLPGVAYSSVGWGDYDNDGRLDILLTGSTGFTNITSQVWRNTGAGFVNINAVLTNVMGSAAAWGDFNNDGFLDIFLGGASAISSSGLVLKSKSEFYRNTNGTFVSLTNAAPNTFLSSASWGDYDNDGLLDLQVRSGIVSRNTGNGFTDVGLFSTAEQGAVAWGDYDNDGRLDALRAGILDSSFPASLVYRNTGNGFTNINAGLPGVSAGSVAWGDYDNDGRLDILLAGSTLQTLGNPITQIWRNTGSGFTNINAGLPGVLRGCVVWGDLDNDGWLDIVLTGATSAVGQIPTNFISQIWRNTGGAFTKLEDLTGVACSSVALGDYDNDGRLDIVLTGATGLSSSNGLPTTVLSQVLRNNFPVANTAPSPPTGLSATLAGDSVNLTWNSGSDAQTPSAALSYNVRIGTTPGASDVLAPMSAGSGLRRLPQMGNAQLGLGAKFKYVMGTPYYWSVQTVDHAFAGSAFSAVGSFKILQLPPPPQPPPVLVSASTTTLVPGDLNGDGTLDESEWNQLLASYWPNSPWMQMTNIAGLGGTNVTFALSNSTAGAFSVEVTTNLVNWQFLGPAIPRYLFTDTNAPTNPQRYYRLRWP